MNVRHRPRLPFEFGMLDVDPGLTISHQYQREPAIVRPGRPVLLRASAAEPLTDMTVTVLVSDEAVLRRLDL